MYASAGAFSCCITNLVCQPLEVIKVRLQLQVEPISKTSKSSKYTGMIQAARVIYKEESVRALWKGHVPSQILTASSSFVHFGTFEVIKAYANMIEPGATKHISTVFLASSTASTSATLVTFPFYLLRTRMIAQGNNIVYRRLAQALFDIYKMEGPRGFYKGLLPALLQTVPMAGTSFSLFALLKDTITVIPKEEVRKLTVTESLVAGGLAGLVSKSLLYPLDLTVKRMQMQGFHSVRKDYGEAFICSGVIHCIKETIRRETFFGLYKGLIPSLTKSVAVSGLTFGIYDQVSSLLPPLL